VTRKVGDKFDEVKHGFRKASMATKNQNSIKWYALETGETALKGILKRKI